MDQPPTPFEPSRVPQEHPPAARDSDPVPGGDPLPAAAADPSAFESADGPMFVAEELDPARELPSAAEAEIVIRPPAPARDADHGSPVGHFKETIESILIAFILAFVFRAFVVEAFVIPTGSMAPTLLGAHMRFTCRECGYVFDVNYPARPSNAAGDDIEIPSRAGADRVFGAYCPNCKHKVEREQAEDPYIRYGDRILVLKYLYIPWISQPQRWDVVVFKTPQGGSPPYTVNYIKRLIGLPGEEVMILDGDVYVRTDRGWEVQTKPRHAQDALWRVVYDNDFRPLEVNRQDGWRFPWRASGHGWDTGDKTRAREFTFTNMGGPGALAFVPPPRQSGQGAEFDQDARYLTDWLAYNVTFRQDSGDAYDTSPFYTHHLFRTSDLKLSFDYRRLDGDGPLRARLTKYGHEFTAELTPGRARLLHRRRDGTEVEIGAAALRTDGAPVRVELMNVDYRASLVIDGQVVAQTTPDQYAPDVTWLLEQFRERAAPPPAPSIRIEAEKQEAVLAHVGLWRDVYYTPRDAGGTEARHAHPPTGRDGTGPIKLASRARDGAENEYFVCGDNSAASWDARFWDRDVFLKDERLWVEDGRVPERFMLGRAFFVYWPAGHRPLSNAPPVVPNFGEMRLIR